MGKIIVTGATGYLGYKITEKFHECGFSIIAIVRKTSDTKKLRQLIGKENIFVYHGGYDELECLFSKHEIDMVVHLAAFFAAEHQKHQIDELIDSNVRFSMYLLEAMKNTGVSKMINTSTSWQNYNEEAYNPVSFYAATKQMVEDGIRYYTEACNMNVVSLVIYDTYGKDDTRKKLLSLLKQAADTGISIPMSPGQQKVDYVYISDIAAAYELTYQGLMEGCFKGFQRFCLNSGREVALRELAALFGRIYGTPVPVEWGGREYRKREVMEPYHKGIRLPGWSPAVTLEEGIRKCVNVE